MIEASDSLGAARETEKPTARRSSVAAVVPTFNESRSSLERTLRGLQRQTRKLESLIVVDDASPEPTLIPYQLKSDVEVLRLPDNVGPGQARNLGVQHTTADYILFVDCDVVLTRDWLEGALAFMKTVLSAGAVSGAFVPVAGPKVLRDWQLQFIEPKVHRSVVSGPTRVGWLVGHVVLVRRSAFDEVGGFDARFRYAAEDWDFSQRILSQGYSLFHLPGLIAESHEIASIDGLARKSMRKAGWDLRREACEHPCAGMRPTRALSTPAAIARVFVDRAARNLVKRRFRFFPVDLAIALRSLVLLWHANRPA
jgi:glycosyltransferase involved in cell wall biosynthesis